MSGKPESKAARLSVLHLRHLHDRIAARQALARGAQPEAMAGLEAAGGLSLTRTDADEVMHRLDQTLRALPADEQAEPEDFRRALDLVRAHVPRAVDKLVGIGGRLSAPLDHTDIGALEAVVKADGSRPSFLIRDGGPPPLGHPFMGAWAGMVGIADQQIRAAAPAVGRVQPAGGHNGRFVGTAFYIGEGLALTNYHVMRQCAAGFGIAMDHRADGTSRLIDELHVDFNGEAGAIDARLFRVVEFISGPQGGDGSGFVDMVAMRLEPVGGASFPAPLRVSRQAERLQEAQGEGFFTIGFPARPVPDAADMQSGVDWTFVIQTLFGGPGKFGLKRLAPGRILHSVPLGGDMAALQPDPLGITFSHDATTFGGASGSPLLTWGDMPDTVFGLHFAGLTSTANFAIAGCCVGASLQALKVP